ncbi:glycosyltransferase family 15 protein [Ascoidea rubescens DSM 1968]|uniref:Glycosyltransferase family 15 protein n=1 Tax=Ascoidea rubescens DSM 1968 TaxID=1344418 RepID=A0A1D2VMS1_9ASCO|nr:glycosyltransferase family 15 protein [Ascoidea rubescens DSM 1968]ODV62845.1 glycosyltransferase family 15 protein [Ascoidea rubescens DSM 1968]
MRLLINNYRFKIIALILFGLLLLIGFNLTSLHSLDNYDLVNLSINRFKNLTDNEIILKLLDFDIGSEKDDENVIQNDNEDDKRILLNKTQYEEIFKQVETKQYNMVAKSKAKATFVTLARNSELWGLVNSIRSVEDRFNRKFHYDWVFLNDDDFSEEFIETTKSLCSGKVKYGKIPKEQWSYPDFIDIKKADKARSRLKELGVIYGDSESYRHMCRFESGFFWRHPLLDEYDWYWRVEPDIKFYCDIDYDVFKFMEDNNKVYGFTISLMEYQRTIPSLWRATKGFIRQHPQYLHKNNFLKFISDNKGKTYNLCHFWSNFEIASLNFFRSDKYREYFEYLDKTGGFFYERWGDAPIHSIAVSLFEDREKIHHFGDLGYTHDVFTSCPIDKEFRKKQRCSCNPQDDFDWTVGSCTWRYFELNRLKKPEGWQNYKDW